MGYSTIVLTISISATTNPSMLVFPTPLFPQIDPRTAPKGTQGLVLQLWKIHVQDYTDEHIKSASVKGYYGFVRPVTHFEMLGADLSLSTVQLHRVSFPTFNQYPLRHPYISHLFLTRCSVPFTTVTFRAHSHHP